MHAELCDSRAHSRTSYNPTFIFFSPQLLHCHFRLRGSVLPWSVGLILHNNCTLPPKIMWRLSSLMPPSASEQNLFGLLEERPCFPNSPKIKRNPWFATRTWKDLCRIIRQVDRCEEQERACGDEMRQDFPFHCSVCGTFFIVQPRVIFNSLCPDSHLFTYLFTFFFLRHSCPNSQQISLNFHLI